MSKENSHPKYKLPISSPGLPLILGAAMFETEVLKEHFIRVPLKH